MATCSGPCADRLVPDPALCPARPRQARRRLHDVVYAGDLWAGAPGFLPAPGDAGHEEVAIVFRDERDEVEQNVVLANQRVVLLVVPLAGVHLEGAGVARRSASSDGHSA